MKLPERLRWLAILGHTKVVVAVAPRAKPTAAIAVVSVHTQPNALRGQIVGQRPHPVRELRGVHLELLRHRVALVDQVPSVDIERPVAHCREACGHEGVAELPDEGVVDGIVEVIPGAVPAPVKNIQLGK
eukprot:COSAG02_NODE_673_length_18630_cov_7.960768_5_plen_130_part_00